MCRRNTIYLSLCYPKQDVQHATKNNKTCKNQENNPLFVSGNKGNDITRVRQTQRAELSGREFKIM